MNIQTGYENKTFVMTYIHFRYSLRFMNGFGAATTPKPHGRFTSSTSNTTVALFARARTSRGSPGGAGIERVLNQKVERVDDCAVAMLDSIADYRRVTAEHLPVMIPVE